MAKKESKAKIFFEQVHTFMKYTTKSLATAKPFEMKFKDKDGTEHTYSILAQFQITHLAKIKIFVLLNIGTGYSWKRELNDFLNDGDILPYVKDATYKFVDPYP